MIALREHSPDDFMNFRMMDSKMYFLRFMNVTHHMSACGGPGQ